MMSAALTQTRTRSVVSLQQGSRPRGLGRRQRGVRCSAAAVGDAVPSADNTEGGEGTVGTSTAPRDTDSAFRLPVVGRRAPSRATAGQRALRAYESLGDTARTAALWGGGAAALSLCYAAYSYYRKWSSPRQRKLRGIKKNLAVVTEIDGLLREDIGRVTPKRVREIRRELGFTKDEIFRKMVRYALSERSLDAACVSQLLHLRDACDLSIPETRETLAEIARRVHQKHGGVMFRPSGLTEAGLSKKATACALFAKLLYLHETPEMLGDEGDAATAQLKFTFGAVDEDCDRLRIQSLSSLADVEAMMKGSWPAEEAKSSQAEESGAGEGKNE